MRNEIIVGKILDYCEKLIRYCDGYSYETFSKNTILVEACVFNLSQIGELSHSVDADFAAAHQAVPWAEMYGLRNRIVHDYEGVNLILVWEIISDDIPRLKKLLQNL